MALLTCNFHSQILGYDTSVRVILPEIKEAFNSTNGPSPKYKTLYLLHGMGDDSSSWTRFTSIEKYAKDYSIAIIMPTATHSFYSDAVYGKKFFTYISQELPQIMNSWFSLSDRPEDTFIAGLSMGGYGALKIGFNFPERFGGIAGFSPVTSLEKLDQHIPKPIQDTLDEVFPQVFGCRIPSDEEHGILPLAMKNLTKLKSYPKIIQYIGTEDFLYDLNVEFKQQLTQLDIPFIYEEWSGEHDWNFWDIAILKTLKIFFNEEVN